MNDKSKAKYKRYDEAFKRQAVEHWLVSGKSGRQIASELGINEQSLKIWKQKFKQLPAGQVAPTLDALQAENRRLSTKPGQGHCPNSSDCSAIWSIGIVWVHSNHRRKGWAIRLVNQAGKFFCFEDIQKFGWYTPFSSDGEALVRNLCPIKFRVGK